MSAIAGEMPTFVFSVLASAERSMAAAAVDESRARLGEFACDREVLLYAWALADLYEDDEGSRSSMNNFFGDALGKWADDNGMSHPQAYDAVSAELEMWRGLPEVWGTVARELTDRVEFLVLLESHPLDHHPYLLTGVTDFDAIEDFLANNIDPALAASAAT